MTPVRILHLCKGMNSWNAGECMPCLNVLRTEQNKKPNQKTKPQIPTMHCGFVRHGELWCWQTMRRQWGQHREMCSCRFLCAARRRTCCEKSGACSGKTLSLPQYKVIVEHRERWNRNKITHGTGKKGGRSRQNPLETNTRIVVCHSSSTGVFI